MENLDLIKSLTVEQRIVQEYGVSVSDLLAEYAGQGMTSKQVAIKLDCGVSNVRRIARKYGIRFNQPAPQEKIVHSEEFREHNLNDVNFLSRSWSVYLEEKEMIREGEAAFA